MVAVHTSQHTTWRTKRKKATHVKTWAQAKTIDTGTAFTSWSNWKFTKYRSGNSNLNETKSNKPWFRKQRWNVCKGVCFNICRDSLWSTQLKQQNIKLPTCFGEALIFRQFLSRLENIFLTVIYWCMVRLGSYLFVRWKAMNSRTKKIKSSESEQLCPLLLWLRWFVQNDFLVGGFNPFEKYSSNWVHLPQIGMKIPKICQTTTQFRVGFDTPKCHAPLIRSKGEAGAADFMSWGRASNLECLLHIPTKTLVQKVHTMEGHAPNIWTNPEKQTQKTDYDSWLWFIIYWICILTYTNNPLTLWGSRSVVAGFHKASTDQRKETCL